VAFCIAISGIIRLVAVSTPEEVLAGRAWFDAAVVS